MDRPYIICHMLVSYDNKITGGFMFSPEVTGLIDELSLVRVPLVEDNDKEVSLFGKEEVPQPLFELKSAEKLGNGGEWLRYLIK